MAHRFVVLAAVLAWFAVSPAHAAKVQPVHRFADTGSTQSQFGLGSTPVSELVQASDGNFYGTTEYGGSGRCTDRGGSIIGCGTIFRMTPAGAVTVLYSFLLDTTTNTSADGVFPTAGLIQATDGYLYGVASDGGIGGCNGAFGCGTLFRIATSGGFQRLHQFCDGQGCTMMHEGVYAEGGHPAAHLVQRPNGSLCGTTEEGGGGEEGTLFCASTGGAVTTLYDFDYKNGTDGYAPTGALLVGADGTTLYGTTEFEGANGGGTVFAFRGGVLTILHAFDSVESSTPGTYFEPLGALIFGADGRLYGTTSSGGIYGCIYSVNTDGTGFVATPEFNGDKPASFPVAGLVLGGDGMMYGTTRGGSIVAGAGNDGAVYRFNPTTAAYTGLAAFTTSTGAMPLAALIEGKDKYLYGTASVYGGSNSRGTDEGSVYRITPPLTK